MCASQLAKGPHHDRKEKVQAQLEANMVIVQQHMRAFRHVGLK